MHVNHLVAFEFQALRRLRLAIDGVAVELEAQEVAACRRLLPSPAAAAPAAAAPASAAAAGARRAGGRAASRSSSSSLVSFLEPPVFSNFEMVLMFFFFFRSEKHFESLRQPP